MRTRLGQPRKNIKTKLPNDEVSKTLDLHSSTYDKITLLGDFNIEIDEQHMQSFCDNYFIKSLIRQPTCYKNFGKPTCRDLILTNMPRSFRGRCVIETGLSDFHLKIKMKHERGNHMPFITKDPSKAIMKRSKLRNNYLKNKTDANRMLCLSFKKK